MGALILERSRASWWAAAGSLAAAVSTCAVVVAGSVAGGPTVVAVLAVGALVLGLVGGSPAIISTSACLQVGAVAWLVRSDDSAPSAVIVVGAVVVWLSFELGLTSLDMRGDRATTAAFWWARVTDLLGLAALGGAVGVVALAVAGSGPTGSALLLRAGGLGVAAVVVVGLLVLSRRPRRS
jgi:hypothetical protein